MSLDAMLDRGTVDRITAEAREIHFAQTMLMVLATVFYGLGWITARVLGGVWLAITWSFTATRLGWREGRMRRVEA